MTRRLKSAALVPLVALAAVPALAQADRTPTAAESKAIATAAKVPARCLKIRVSSVDDAYAGIWRRNLKKGCGKYQADGVAVFKKGHHGWKFVTAGSSFECPVPKVPRAVAKDLKIACHG